MKVRPKRKRRILVVDDTSGVRQTLEMVLGYWGYEAVVASDGIQGLVKFAGHSFDLALVDYSMPGMNGMELARRLKDKDLDIPVVMISGEDEKTLEHCMNSPLINCVLFKPFTMDELRVAVDPFLNDEFRLEME